MITEKSSLSDCEVVIGTALRSLKEAGKALNLIRENKLWNGGGYNNFDHYCQERWSFLGAHGLKLINNYKTLQLLIDWEIITEEQATKVTSHSLTPFDGLKGHQKKEAPVLYKKALDKTGGKLPSAKEVKHEVKEYIQTKRKAKIQQWVKVAAPRIKIEEYDEWSKNFENLSEKDYLYKMIIEDIKKKRRK